MKQNKQIIVNGTGKLCRPAIINSFEIKNLELSQGNRLMLMKLETVL